MNQRREPDSKTNTEILEQTKSTSQPRRARPKTKRQAPTNLIKSFKLEPSFSLKPNLPASNRRGKHNSNHTNHHSGSLSHKTSYICSIHTRLSPPAIEEGSTTATIPTIIQAVCCIKQVIFAPFITNDYLPEMIRKIILANNFP